MGVSFRAGRKRTLSYLALRAQGPSAVLRPLSRQSRITSMPNHPSRDSSDRPSDPNRRDFLRIGGAAVVAGAAAVRGVATNAQNAPQAAKSAPFSTAPIPLVRIGYVGVGLQGSGHVRNLLRIPGCRIVAVCDVRSE